MAKRKKLNPLVDTPANKNDLTKNFMVAYVKAIGTDADKTWFKALAAEHTIEKTNALDGKKVKTINIKPFRTAFCDRFFPQFNVKTNTTTDFFDEINNL